MHPSRLFLAALFLPCAISGLTLSPALTQRSPAEPLPQTKRDRPSTSISLKPQTVVLSFGKKGAAFPDYREARIQYPIASGLTNATVLQKVQTAISLKQVVGQSLAEMKQEYKENQWLTEVAYAVNYNRNNLLDLTYAISGVGAYPSSFEKHVAVNLKTGQRVRAKDLFKAEGLGAIAQTVDRMMQREIQQKIAEVKQQEPDLGIDRFANHRFQPKNLEDFTLGTTGVTFHYNFEFPHVIKAIEPSGSYLLPYTQLIRYIRQDGVLAFHLK
ncbi:hypothetical protein [Altericista sp. CCNU0014]|uniref:hypothetical protein n=1 Tax=Altericista sp. CCNU0014 TaxID=3082949 RepID=UPI00384BD433